MSSFFDSFVCANLNLSDLTFRHFRFICTLNSKLCDPRYLLENKSEMMTHHPSDSHICSPLVVSIYDAVSL